MVIILVCFSISLAYYLLMEAMPTHDTNTVVQMGNCAQLKQIDSGQQTNEYSVFLKEKMMTFFNLPLFYESCERLERPNPKLRNTGLVGVKMCH